MTLRMYCVADWVNYYLYDYTDILTSLRTVQDLTVASGSAVIRWDPEDPLAMVDYHPNVDPALPQDRKSTRLNSSHCSISYAVFCLKKKISTPTETT